MKRKFYIKERYNPQLGTYFIACGQMSKKEAIASGSPLYGINRMLGFDTEKEYEARLSELRKAGEKVQ